MTRNLKFRRAPYGPHETAPSFSMTEYNTLLRQDLMTFTQRSFHQLNPQVYFRHGWHLDLIADRLERCRRGEIRRLIINVPPRSLKSILASVALPAFWLGHDPSAQILCASYGQDLADKLSADCRQVMASNWYQEHFPTRLSRNRNAVQEFTTTANGSRMATSVGGVVTGRGADLIILDDPLKPEEALSDSQRQKVNDWFDGTLFSRQNQKETGIIIVIMQRLHTDDLVGHLMERGGWEVLSLPAIAEAIEEFTYDTAAGPRRHLRRPGDLLHPERESQAVLDEIRRNLGEYAFAGQYQQTPVPFGGAIVKDKWWGVYQERPEKFDHMIQSWDTANKATELSDYSVCTTWGKKGPNLYLVHVFRQRLNYPDLKRSALELREVFQPDEILIEDRASGTQLIQELKVAGVYGARPVKPEGDKIMRMHAQSAKIENGFVWLPASAPWLDEYRSELSAFPKGRFADQVDSTSQALAYFSQRRQPLNITPELLRKLGGHPPFL